MADKHIDTIVVGAGQAGIAMSEHLSAIGVEHLLLEKNRIAENWRTARWDSLVANGPAWHDRFPNMTFNDMNPDGFVPKEKVADYFAAYAKMIAAPVRTGVEVQHVEPIAGTRTFTVQTTAGTYRAKRVIAATGPFQKPNIPPIAPPESAGLQQLHSSAYRNPDQLPDGAVLVVGGGSSGVQIADELSEHGRDVYLSIGEHERPPRFYRGRDYDWWLGVLGLWDDESKPGMQHAALAVSGAHGGRTIDFRALAGQGITLLGMTKGYTDGKMSFQPDLKANIRKGDENYVSLLDAADAYIERTGLDLPPEPEARHFLPDPPCISEPLLELDLAAANIRTIIWATGFKTDFSWLHVDTFDDRGRALYTRGVSRVPGIYFLGLPWLSCRGSSFIWGVWHDAKHIADHIAKQNRYFAYQGLVQPDKRQAVG